MGSMKYFNQLNGQFKLIHKFICWVLYYNEEKKNVLMVDYLTFVWNILDVSETCLALELVANNYVSQT